MCRKLLKILERASVKPLVVFASSRHILIGNNLFFLVFEFREVSLIMFSANSATCSDLKTNESYEHSLPWDIYNYLEWKFFIFNLNLQTFEQVKLICIYHCLFMLSEVVTTFSLLVAGNSSRIIIFSLSITVHQTSGRKPWEFQNVALYK